MIVNYSLQKEPVSANNILINISSTQNTKAMAPTERDKIRAVNHDMAHFNS